MLGLPSAYSPDLNPIEQVFAKLKTLLRHECVRYLAKSTFRYGGPKGDVSAVILQYMWSMASTQ